MAEVDAALLREFMARTDADEAVAASFLEAHENDLEAGVADYQSQLEEGDEAEDEAAEEGEDAPQSDAVIAEPDVPAAESCDKPDEPVDTITESEGLVEALEEVSLNADKAPAAEASPSQPVEDTKAAEQGDVPASESPKENDEENAEDETFKQVDEVAQRIRKEAAALAADAALEAKEYVSKMATSIKTAPIADFSKSLSNWWSSIDSSLGMESGKPTEEPDSAKPAAAAKEVSTELQAMFPNLSATEHLIEKFKCKLVQTYACSHNTHTPDIQMAFEGTLYITDKHTCFDVEEQGRKLPITLEHAAVIQVERVRPVRRSDKNDTLKLSTGENQFIAVKDFAPGNLDSALALLEHLCEKSESEATAE
mmetsp:Transcript_30631/g.57693  ORF Transcript_30631/g.57693 Transcript_30631/m.57693 type:complete len:368 (+) Transcript_30631:94-1197(+)